MDRQWWTRSAWVAAWHVPRQKSAPLAAVIALATVGLLWNAVESAVVRSILLSSVGFGATWAALALLALVEQRKAINAHLAALETEDVRIRDLMKLRSDGRKLLNAYRLLGEPTEADRSLLFAWEDELRRFAGRQSISLGIAWLGEQGLQNRLAEEARTCSAGLQQSPRQIVVGHFDWEQEHIGRALERLRRDAQRGMSLDVPPEPPPLPPRQAVSPRRGRR